MPRSQNFLTKGSPKNYPNFYQHSPPNLDSPFSPLRLLQAVVEAVLCNSVTRLCKAWGAGRSR
ncbi:hypothetical protein COLO4_36689 [Corchorus olitorius]|uniref:Uncharacterized protein n=1 Tax=Corchorus olitorius TaxID=93759 RepID=A0A1R3G6C1_9ROSI|nr:hypothetical protein COLO4_36689 [Corchorus olitorius]